MASIQKYATKKGARWRVQYRDPAGKSRTKSGFTRKTDAQAWAAKNTVAISDQEWIDPALGRTTVGELGNVWLESLTHLKPSTMRVVDQHWRNYVQPRWGDTPVSVVRHSDVQAWVASIGRSATIVRGAHNALAQILDLAVADRLIKVNPARGVKLPAKGKPVKVYLTIGQLKELADECSRHGELVWLLGTSGLRFGEAVALRPMDLDPLRSRITVERNAVTVGTDCVIGTPKSNERRTVAVARAVMDKLVALAEGKARDGLLWPRADGSPLRVPSHGSWFYEAMDRVLERNAEEIATAHAELREPPAKFPRVTPHGLRHVAAGLLIQAGANVKVVQRQLGHASAALTLDVYADLWDDGLDEIATTLDVVVRGVS
ncbi:site-specific integrase [Corynebacterium cystitidis]|uniref:site-specific integrase n=1 Tax=Corynebacterium cystitidis TaxID=35757 RepID=UPI00211DB957|nr:site-specific integrase [Corynebacterium cystitidis]